MAYKWDTAVVHQAARGTKKAGPPPKAKPALKSRDVRRLIKAAVAKGEQQAVDLMAISRFFLLRIQS